MNSIEEIAAALEEFAMIGGAEGGNPTVIEFEIAAAQRLRSMLAEMKAAAGYLRNAKIDLETGCPKATAIRTIEGGLKRLEAAIGGAA